jgi:hypothetical protein
MYHRDPETDSARIVGFEVTPKRCGTLFLCSVFPFLASVTFLLQCNVSFALLSLWFV